MLVSTTRRGAKLLLIDDVSPENMTMIQALYARSSVSAEERVKEIHEAERAAMVAGFLKVAADDFKAPMGFYIQLAEEALAVAHGHDVGAKARRISEKFLVGYGHKSIGDNGSFTLCAEGVSMLAAKAIEQSPLFNGQEMSTRAVDMTKQPVLDPIGTSDSRAIQDVWIALYDRAQGPVADETRRRHPRGAGEDEATYEGAVKYRTFDVTRCLLPAGSTTNASLHTTIRHANDHLSFLANHPLEEVREIGIGWSALAREAYPSSGDFGHEATVSGVGRDGRAEERAAWLRELWAKRAYEPDAASVKEWAFDTTLRLSDALGEALSHLDRSDAEPRFEWDEDADFWGRRPRGVRLPHEMSILGQLRWSFLLDFGSFRDLQRHRYMILPMPELTLSHGFEPWYLDEMPRWLADEVRRTLVEQEGKIASLTSDPLLRQYYVAMGYRVGCYATMGLPAFAYFAELRSGKTIHPTLREVVLRMIRDFERVHPEVKLHVDRDPDGWAVRRGAQNIVRKDGGAT